MGAWKRWAAFIVFIIGIGCKALSAEAGSIFDSPYVTFSPDGKAWTADAGNQNIEFYPEDGSATVVTGIKSSLRSLQKGEHYYNIVRQGSLPVGRWEVQYMHPNCCHNDYPESGEYHGIAYATEVCLKGYFSAWFPVCADCGEYLLKINMYMSRAAVQSLHYLELRDDLAYYYLCPFNANLEQGASTKRHVCKDISVNRYRVEYLPNAGTDTYGGYMLPSYHTYNNATVYEGEDILPQTRLSRNSYSRIGWKFAGWNTRADGSGKFYADEAEILNLCEEDYRLDQSQGAIQLYAVWERVSSILEIDPAGGRYMNDAGITKIKRDYGSVYEPDPSRVQPPYGCTVSFVTGDGNAISPITGTRHFVEWEQKDDFRGKWGGNKYTFFAPDGNTDRIAAVYAYDPVILPQPYKDNVSFGGWYYDAGFTMPAGKAGDAIVPTRDMTLYAQWVELMLEADDNYTANNGRGAVDLSWCQQDGSSKNYKVFQSIDGAEWEMVTAASDISSVTQVTEVYEYSGHEEEYTVPYSGFYTLTAYGAQGGDYQSFKGGLGGKAEGRFWLEKGEVLLVSVGGQDGYNGGGRGEKYANGGGCTTIYSRSKGLLLTAGGGGGATDGQDGQAGGSRLSLVGEGTVGESGPSGGGGGYQGGHAGELIVHNHIEGVCNHVHQGSSNKYGGCYTKKVLCNEKLKHEYSYTHYWKWGGYDTIYCPCCGANANLGEDCVGHRTDYYKNICPTHGSRGVSSLDAAPTYCSVVVSYAPACNLSEEYTCGYPCDGYVISSKPAYGGSSFINDQLVYYSEQEAGVSVGNGSFMLASEDIGFLPETSIDGVLAEDREPPDMIALTDISRTGVGENTVLITWRRPLDRGTSYYHKVESYPIASSIKLCTSNITINTLTSGIKGYYFCIDSFEDTRVSSADGIFTEQERVEIELPEVNSYFHVCAVDAAGNLAEVTHIPLGSGQEGAIDVAWPVFTRPLTLPEQGENVYRAQGTDVYYIKGDGETPFTIGFEAYIQGPATEEYQINYAVLKTLEEGKEAKNIVGIPGTGISDAEIVIDVPQMSFYTEGAPYLENDSYTFAVRSDRNRELRVLQKMVLSKDANGHILEILPAAGADFGQNTVWSDSVLDKINGITVIGDSEAPEIKGAEQIEENLLIDRRNGRVRIRLSASDELSGLREFRMTARNLDNGAVKEWYCDEKGMLEADITEDEPVFSGDFQLEVYARDNVGNEAVLIYETTEFDLQVEVERILDSDIPLFKRGESGILHITTWGYAERVEIEFPEELAEYDESLNHIYVYEWKQRYRQEEEYTFMIPLKVPENTQYTIKVRAYKGEKMLERYPAFSVIGVEGTVLDEIRTRLR